MLTLEQLAAINHAVYEMRRCERVRATSPTDRSSYAAACAAVMRCEALDVGHLLPDEVEVIAAERVSWLDAGPRSPLRHIAERSQRARPDWIYGELVRPDWIYA